MTVMSRRRWPGAGWWDLMLAAAFGIACEAEVVVHLRGDRAHDHWPAAAVVSIVAGIAVAVAARRKAPLAAASVAMAGIVVLALSLSHLTGINSPQLVLFVAPYSVAAYPRHCGLDGVHSRHERTKCAQRFRDVRVGVHHWRLRLLLGRRPLHAGTTSPGRRASPDKRENHRGNRRPGNPCHRRPANADCSGIADTRHAQREHEDRAKPSRPAAARPGLGSG
jgi:hypothetical protein